MKIISIKTNIVQPNKISVQPQKMLVQPNKILVQPKIIFINQIYMASTNDSN